MPRLVCPLPDGAEVAMGNLDAENLRAPAGSLLAVRLPFGHMAELSYLSLTVLDYLACLYVTCADCGHGVLSEEQRRQVLVSLERDEGMRFVWSRTCSEGPVVLLRMAEVDGSKFGTDGIGDLRGFTGSARGFESS